MNVDNIANNLANANTTGYKMRRTQFQDLLYQNMVQPGAAAGPADHRAQPVCSSASARAPASNEIIFTQGSFSQTDNPLDLVIQGNGFFQIRQPTGDSRLHARRLVSAGPERQPGDSNGNPLEPQITIPAQAQAITIATDGTVSYTLPGPDRRADRGADSARALSRIPPA